MKNNKTVEEWLSEFAKPKTRTGYRNGLKKFLAWYKKPISTVLKMKPKDAKHLILTYQKDMVAKGIKTNTIRISIASLRSLYAYENDVSLKFNRGKLLQQEEATDKHQFSNGDLRTMFEHSNIRAKALISLGSSLGWGISDVLALKRSFIESLIDRSKENNETFIFFKRQRIKTKAKAYGILNPLSIEWLSKWLRISNGKTRNDKLFDIDQDMINKELQRIAKESGIKTIGNVTFHCFRGWTMSTLIKCGFSEYETKYVVGKSIPISDMTYLSLEESIEEKYIKNYDEYFNIGRKEATPSQKEFSEKITELEQKLKDERLIRKGMVEVMGEEIHRKAIENLKPMLKTFKASGPGYKPDFKRVENLTELLREIGRSKERKEKELEQKVERAMKQSKETA